MIITSTTYEVKCDFCYSSTIVQKGTVQFPDSSNGLPHPNGWYIVIGPTKIILHFDSMQCLTKWVDLKGLKE